MEPPLLRLSSGLRRGTHAQRPCVQPEPGGAESPPCRFGQSLRVLNNPELPSATYGLVELYCDERGCDCRRVVFNLLSEEVKAEERGPLATVSFGWEPVAFYRQWASFPLSKAELHELRGPALMSMAPQSRYAPALLEAIKPVLADGRYVDRLVRHYRMYRDVIDSAASAASPRPRRRLGRRAMGRSRPSIRQRMVEQGERDEQSPAARKRTRNRRKRRRKGR